MAFSTQDIRENYERKETEELLSLTGNDLTEVAREVLNEVLAARGLSPEVVNEERSRIVEEHDRDVESPEKLATIPARFAAFAVDFLGVGAIIYAVLLPIGMFSDAAREATYLAIFWAYFLFRDGIPGQGLGKRLMALRTEQLIGKRASFANSFWRNLTHFLFVVDALFALGERRMRLGDMIAGTHVVKK